MATNATRPDKATDENRTDHTDCFPPMIVGHVRLGTDEHGADHVLDAATAAVHVIDGASRTDRIDLTDRPERPGPALGAYVDHVDTVRGWAEPNFHRDNPSIGTWLHAELFG